MLFFDRRRAVPSVQALAALFTAITITALGATAARSADCGPAIGKVLVDDVFTDNLNGWDEDKAAVFGKPHLALELTGSDTDWNYTTSSFDARNADYCLELTVPRSPTADNLTDAGLVFDFVGEDDKFQMLVYSDGSALLERESGGRYSTLYEAEKLVPPLVPGAAVVLRAMVKDGLITAFIDGVQVKQVRAKMSDAPRSFGVYAERHKAVPAATPITFDRLRVTELP